MAAVAGAPGPGEGGEAAEPDSDNIPVGGRLSEPEPQCVQSEPELSLSPARTAWESQCAAQHGSEAALQLGEQGLALPDLLLAAGPAITHPEAESASPDTPEGAERPPGGTEDGIADIEMGPLKAELVEETPGEETMQWRESWESVPPAQEQHCMPGQAEPDGMELEENTAFMQEESTIDSLPGHPPEDIEMRPVSITEESEESSQGFTEPIKGVLEAPFTEGPVPVELVTKPGLEPVEQMENSVNEGIGLVGDPERLVTSQAFMEFGLISNSDIGKFGALKNWVPDKVEVQVSAPEKVELFGAPVHGEGAELFGAPVHGEGAELFGAPAHGEGAELFGAPVHGEGAELFGAPVHGEGAELFGAPVHGEGAELFGAPVHGEGAELFGAPVHGEGAELFGAPVHGEGVELAGAPVHGEGVELAGAPVHGEGVELAGAPVHGEGVELAGAPVHGEGVELAGAPVHGEGVELAGAPVHGEGVELAGAPVHGEGVELVTGADHGKGDELVTGADHGKGDELVTGADHGKGDELVTGADHGKGDELVTGADHGKGDELVTAPAQGKVVQLLGVPAHAEGVEVAGAPAHAEGVEVAKTLVEDVELARLPVEIELLSTPVQVPAHDKAIGLVEVPVPKMEVQEAMPEIEGGLVWAPVIKKADEIAQTLVYKEQIKLVQAHVTEEEFEVERTHLLDEEHEVENKSIQNFEIDQQSVPGVGFEALHILGSEEPTEHVEEVEKPIPHEPLTEDGDKLHRLVCGEIQHTVEIIPVVTSPLEEQRSVKGLLIEGLIYEAAHAIPVQEYEKQVLEPVKAELPAVLTEELLSDVVPGNTQPEILSVEDETVIDQASEQNPSLRCLEKYEEIHHLNPVTTQNHIFQSGFGEVSEQCDPFSSQKEKCFKPDEMIEQFIEPVLKLDKLTSEEICHDFDFVCQATMAPKKTAQMIRDLECESASMDIETCHEKIYENNVSLGNARLIPLGEGLVASSVTMETESGIESSSDCIHIEAHSQEVNGDAVYRDLEQVTCEKGAKSNSVTGEILVDEQTTSRSIARCDGGTDLCVGEPRKSASNPHPQRLSDDSLSYCPSVGNPDMLVIGGIDGLSLGSHVQVTLDHIIQDALVVSFQHGNRLFSGVLMDLSKRFGPHGIPVTIHPKRVYQNRPEEPVPPFPEETQEKCAENRRDTEDVAPIEPSEPCKTENLWTSKPPPLFHEGAPYPPPLFIRDTYNQSIPQPPPRKIKRLKKKIYREEPTSIMNAIKLRPRQVLCDKCKNVVSDRSDIRKSGNDSFKQEQGKRRRHESVTTVNKKLKTDHKVNGRSQSESQKRNAVSKVSNLNHSRGKVVKMTSQTGSTKTQLHSKKVLQSKNMDHAKAREVLKMAKEKAHKRRKETSASKNAHGKVHFTRRLQNTSSGTLPPRLRIKPQRYRNEENDSSLKTGLESLRSAKIGIKPQTRYSATRSAGEVSSEIQSPSNGPEEASSEIQETSVCVPPDEQDEQQTLSKTGSKSNITVYMTLNQTKADSSTASVCSSDSTDDLKSSHSECSSTENFDFPPGSMHTPSSSSSSSSKEEKKLSNSLKVKVFSKNVTKCVTPDGRTICVGDIVWAKIYGFPWWPARILSITVSRKDNGLLVRQEARISWFGSPTTSFLALSQLSPFLENFQSRFNKKRKGLYRKAITEAAKAAKQLTPEVRALLTQFET
ncbi:PWWP domain-containing protein 2A isoform X2 [Pelobates fuscus]|uniref:PWWP domain-containing protein 2A isoform X2 n=1 Tax=Pelobates fuscus TaxID=191477 RepID=UPI002FE4891E